MIVVTTVRDMEEGDIGYVPSWFIYTYSFLRREYAFIRAYSSVAIEKGGICDLKITKRGPVVEADLSGYRLTPIQELSPWFRLCRKDGGVDERAALLKRADHLCHGGSNPSPSSD